MVIRRWSLPHSILVLFLVAGVTDPVSAESGVIKLTPNENSMLVTAESPSVPGHVYNIVIPKTIGEQRMSLVNFPANGLQWEMPKDDGTLVGRYAPGVLMEYTVTLTPKVDHIDVVIVITNHTEIVWKNVWAFTFLAPVTPPAESCLDRIFLPSRDGIIPLSETDRTNACRPGMIFYPITDLAADDIPFQLRAMGCVSETTFEGTWMIAQEENRKSFYGISTPNPLFAFNNETIASVHSAPLLGTLQPGERKQAQITILIGAGSLDQGIQRMTSLAANH